MKAENVVEWYTYILCHIALHAQKLCGYIFTYGCLLMQAKYLHNFYVRDSSYGHGLGPKRKWLGIAENSKT